MQTQFQQLNIRNQQLYSQNSENAKLGEKQTKLADFTIFLMKFSLNDRFLLKSTHLSQHTWNRLSLWCSINLLMKMSAALNPSAIVTFLLFF